MCVVELSNEVVCSRLTTTHADATLFFLSSQVSAIIYFFLSRNIRVARERAYDQTIQSRGKGADWWCPYVEEWDNPPKVKNVKWGWSVFMSGPIGRIVAKGEGTLC